MATEIQGDYGMGQIMKTTRKSAWQLGGKAVFWRPPTLGGGFGEQRAALAWQCVRNVRMGGGMDANPGIGTGGSNQPVPGYVPINGNDIITGNVSGLQYFHGNVGYSSTSTFNGRLGSSNLNNFARQSASGSAGANGVPLGQFYILPSSVVSGSQGARVEFCLKQSADLIQHWCRAPSVSPVSGIRRS